MTALPRLLAEARPAKGLRVVLPGWTTASMPVHALCPSHKSVSTTERSPPNHRPERCHGDQPITFALAAAAALLSGVAVVVCARVLRRSEE